jgi:hypothetical protein
MRDDIQKVIFRYNGDPAAEEAMDHPTTKVLYTQAGEVVERHGKKWKVADVREDFTYVGASSIPVLRIFLTNRYS